MIPFVETDFLEEAKKRFTQQFKNKSVFESYIKIVTDELDELQSVYKDLMQLRDLDNAVGVQLDNIGTIVGQPRVLVDFALFPYFGFNGAPSAETFGTLADDNEGGYFKSLADPDGLPFEVDDTTYRFLIRARIMANKSNTTPQGVIDAMNFILETNDCTLEEAGNAHLIIKYTVTLTPLQDYFLRGVSSIGSIIPLPICVSYELQQI